MNKILLIGIIFVIAFSTLFFVGVIVAATLRNANILALWVLFWIPLGVWIYLAWMVRKEKTELAERRLKRLKKFMLVAGISFVVFIVGTIVHNVLYGLYEEEELVSFCKEHLPTYKTPKSIQFLNSLPKNSIGKILRRELRGSV